MFCRYFIDDFVFFTFLLLCLHVSQCLWQCLYVKGGPPHGRRYVASIPSPFSLPLWTRNSSPEKKLKRIVFLRRSTRASYPTRLVLVYVRCVHITKRAYGTVLSADSSFHKATTCIHGSLTFSLFILITLIQPQITYCLSAFRFHVGSLHQDFRCRSSVCKSLSHTWLNW